MQCFVCKLGPINFIGDDCTCDDSAPLPIVNGVVNGGIQIVVDGVPVVHNG